MGRYVEFTVFFQIPEEETLMHSAMDNIINKLEQMPEMIEYELMDFGDT